MSGQVAREDVEQMRVRTLEIAEETKFTNFMMDISDLQSIRLQHAPTDSTESAAQTKAAYTSYSPIKRRIGSCADYPPQIWQLPDCRSSVFVRIYAPIIEAVIKWEHNQSNERANEDLNHSN